MSQHACSVQASSVRKRIAGKQPLKVDEESEKQTQNALEPAAGESLAEDDQLLEVPSMQG